MIPIYQWPGVEAGSYLDKVGSRGGQADGELLRHVASSIRHQQYHDTDIVTIRVKARNRRPNRLRKAGPVRPNSRAPAPHDGADHSRVKQEKFVVCREQDY